MSGEEISPDGGVADGGVADGGEQKAASSDERKRSKTIVGVVTSDKMQKTRTISVMRLEAHPLYGKYMRKRTKYKYHDEKEVSHLGDTVRIASCRPLAKTKSWRLVEVVEQNKVARLKAEGRKS